MSNVLEKFSVQQVMNVLLRRPATGEILAYLQDTKTSGLENTVEMVYPTGGRGNVYIGNGFAHSRRATFNVSSATWSTEVMALQNGTVIEEDATEVVYYDRIQSKNGVLQTSYTAIGLAGNEIVHLYRLNASATHEQAFEQGDTVGAGIFTYTPATKTIAFDPTEAPLDDEWFECAYSFKPSGSAKIAVSGDAIPSVVDVIAYGIAVDICTGDPYDFQIQGQAQIDGNWSWDISADGDPAVHDLNMEFVKGCLKDELYSFIVYTQDEEATP